MNRPAPLVSLREITADTLRAVLALKVAEHQSGFVAPNAVSLAQALFAPEAWYRAICLDDEPAGFVMLADESLSGTSRPAAAAPDDGAGRPAEPDRAAKAAPRPPSIGVWRFMVDAKFQGRGIGRAAMLLVIEHVRRKGLFRTLELSYVPGPGSPEPFYLGLGFRHTGRTDEGEVVLELPLDEPPATAPQVADLAIDAHDGHPAAETAVVDAGLGRSNDEAARLHEVRPISCFVRRADGQVVGGAVGRRWGECCELQQLWVDPGLRRQGLGSRLVRTFEAHARSRGCRTSYLETFSFQAPELYRKLGYRVEYVRCDYPHGITKVHMSKRIDTIDGAREKPR